MASGAVNTNSSQPGNKWQTSLYEVWTDVSLNWLVCFCPSCAYADSVTRLDGRYAAWCPPCFAHMCSTLILSCALVGADTRRQVRETFQLPQEPFNDYIVHCFCCYCALCQEAREIKYRSQLVAPSSLAAQLVPATDAPEVQLVTRSKSKAVSLKEWEWRPNSGASPAGMAAPATVDTAAGGRGSQQSLGGLPLLVPLSQRPLEAKDSRGGGAGGGEGPGRPTAPGKGPSGSGRAAVATSPVAAPAAAAEAEADTGQAGGGTKAGAAVEAAVPVAAAAILEEGEVEIVLADPAPCSSSDAASPVPAPDEKRAGAS